MRALIVILIAIIVLVVLAIATGFVSITQLRGGRAPEVSAAGNGVSATGAQPPAFDIETGSVKVGTKPANVTLPTLEISRPGNQAEPAANNAM